MIQAGFAHLRETNMSAALKAVLIIVAIAGAPIGYIFYEVALSPDQWIYQGGNPANWQVYRAAPGPMAGVGLPFLVIVAGGTYWFFRQRRKS
jgi:hypothetical protein